MDTKDMTRKIMDIFILSMKSSTEFHELKMFFIHQHFDLLSIMQMNDLVDIFNDSLTTHNYSTNPMLSTYNTIKMALLIYRISWKIFDKKIYSLITKCFVLNKIIIDSLQKYLAKQHHIAQLYRLIREPVFHMTEVKDSLDLMYEMNLSVLLNHPVIIEVINLVNEGQYSVDIQVIDLSQTFQCLLQTESMSNKSIFERLIKNIQDFGDDGLGKQSALQFHIWKHCIDQRIQDAMIFTAVISFCVFILIVITTIIFNNFMSDVYTNFGDYFVHQTTLFLRAEDD